jgi:hypothetical protein
MLALEEVLAMQLEPSSPAAPSSFSAAYPASVDSMQEKKKLHITSPSTTPRGYQQLVGETSMPLYLTLSGCSSKGGLQGSDGSECSERKMGLRHLDLAAMNGGAVSLGHSTLRPATVSVHVVGDAILFVLALA